MCSQNVPQLITKMRVHSYFSILPHKIWRAYIRRYNNVKTLLIKFTHYDYCTWQLVLYCNNVFYNHCQEALVSVHKIVMPFYIIILVCRYNSQSRAVSKCCYIFHMYYHNVMLRIPCQKLTFINLIYSIILKYIRKYS